MSKGSMMKKYLVTVLPILMLSCGVFAEVTKEDINAMRKDVKGMTKEEVITKHIELLEVVKADPNGQNCDAFNVFNKASRKEKKIELMDMEAQNRLFAAQQACGVIF